MRKLLDFLLNKRHWFLFVLLEIISLVFVYRNNNYQRNVMLSSANYITGYLSSLSYSFVSYLNLKEENKALLEKNGYLEMEILRLQDQIEVMMSDTALFKGYVKDSLIPDFKYDFVVAEVVSNSVSHLSNYITLNKGKSDGVMPDMGVVSDNGVVGIVVSASDKYSVVIPLLNPKSRLSCKVLGCNYFGTLSWNGRDATTATLEEMPRHVEFEKGDTIVTSGYSAIFPAGIIVGTIYDYKKQHDDNFYALDIKLATDFTSLHNVRVIRNFNQSEQKTLEKEVNSND